MNGKVSDRPDGLVLPASFDLFELWAWILKREVGLAEIRNLRNQDARGAEPRLVSLLEDWDPELHALKELKQALMNGFLTCHGEGEYGPSEIPRSEWARLEFLFPPPEARDLCSPRSFPWSSLEFPAKEVVSIWPPEGTKSPRSEPPRKRGRPKGSGCIDDAALLGEMRELLRSDEARSVHAAASMVSSRAKGGGNLESKTRRLMRKFNDHQEEPGA